MIVRSLIELLLRLFGLYEEAQAAKKEKKRQENRDEIEDDPIDYANRKFGVRPDKDDSEAP